MADSRPGARRPRPVAEMPPDSVADGVLAAKAWLLALIDAAPLAAAAELPTAELAREAPLLCAAVLRALGSEHELARLLPGGDLEHAGTAAGRLAGASEPAAVAAAVARLRAALWETVSAELPRLDGATTGALSERLAHVCDAILQAALTASGALPPLATPQADPLAALDAELGANRGAGGQPWLRTLERIIAGERDTQHPVALLIVEVDDVERLLMADREGALQALARLDEAVRAAAPATATIVREHAGRLWIVSASLGRGHARALGERLADAAGAVLHRDAPLTVSVGVAISPEDATDAQGLAAHADEGVFAARATGVRLA